MLHANGKQFVEGGAGVDLFFVISGFIMATIIASHPDRTPQRFMFDRFWRIYPMWWIAVVPWILWTLPDWQRVVTSLTLWPVIGTWQTPALRVGWTLSFDMLFYFAVAASIRIGAKPLLGLFALMLMGAYFLRWPIFNYFGNPMIFEFLIGVMIARAPSLPKLTIPLLLIAAIWLVVSPRWINVEVTLRVASAWRVLYWGIPAAMIVYACVSSEHAFSGRYWLVPLIIGDASYSIFLFHPVIVEIPVWWPLKVLLSIGAGVAIWWLVERRVLALRRFQFRHVAAVNPAGQ